MSLNVTQLSGFMSTTEAAGGGGGATCEYRASYTDSGDLTTYSFTSCDIGTAASDRYVIVACHSRNGSGSPVAISSATINGVSATLLPSSHVHSTGGSGPSDVEFIIANVTSGTTGVTISVTYTGGRTRAGISVYAAYGLNSATPTAYATAQGAFSLDTNLNVSDGGFVIGGHTYVNNIGTQTATWTGLTETFDGTLEVSVKASSALATGLSAATPKSVNVTSTGNAGDELYCCASAVSWR